MSVYIEALEKQIPKKPRMGPYNEKSKDEQAWFCPTCNGYLTLIGYTAFVKSFENGFHCQHCGQAIDWNDEER